MTCARSDFRSKAPRHSAVRSHGRLQNLPVTTGSDEDRNAAAHNHEGGQDGKKKADP